MGSDVTEAIDFEGLGVEGSVSSRRLGHAKRQSNKEELLKANRARYLSMDLMSDIDLSALIEARAAYASWLRIVILRTLMHTNALNSLKHAFTFATVKVYGFLGFKNLEEFAATRDLVALREDLLLILKCWEREFGDSIEFPEQLQRNLMRLGEMAGLVDCEIKVLGLAILLHTEGLLQEVTELIGNDVSAFSLPKIFAPMLGFRVADVEAALDEQSNLMRSGLLSLDHRGEGNLRSRVDLLNWIFAKHAVIKQRDVRDLLSAYIRPAGKSELTLVDYAHIHERFLAIKHYLIDALQANRSGVNILVYGLPGTGKSEMAKLIAAEIGCELMEVAANNPKGYPVTPMQRIRSYRLAQSFFRKGNALILFDECEEVLGGEFVPSGEHSPPQAQKSWINLMLESNASPTIWLANSISEFDNSYIRRFDMCFEMPMPDEFKRREMLTKMCGQEIHQDLIFEIAKNKNSSPALVAKTAQVVKVLARDKTPEQCSELALMLVNDKLAAQGDVLVPSIDQVGVGMGFVPEMTNSAVNLDSLCSGISKIKEARICVYGPPGTGKTAFGKWLANSLGVQHQVLKSSDLLGSRVGETEWKIAKAFETAKQEKALLQFDEVDTFLMSRHKAKQSWEISMTNTMLVEMEQFKGVFIASTNLHENIDEAALRRFDISLKFDFMLPSKAWDMFVMTCDRMGLSVNEAELRPRFMGMGNLTPGDFEQVCRQARFIAPGSSQELFLNLEKAVSVKQSAKSRQIGFLI